MASITKEFHRLMKNIDKLTDGQAIILDIDWDNGSLHKFHVIIRPNSDLYKNGNFDFQITLPKNYPDIPPVVYCHTDIYHPNIDPTVGWSDDNVSNVCINIFEHHFWNRSFGLEGTVLSLLFLMHNPNSLDPVSPYFEDYEEQELFEENVGKYMAGELCGGRLFLTGFCVKDGVSVMDSKNEASREIDIEDMSVLGKGVRPILEKSTPNEKAENIDCSTYRNTSNSHSGSFESLAHKEDIEICFEWCNTLEKTNSMNSFHKEEVFVLSLSNDKDETDSDVDDLTCIKSRLLTETENSNHHENFNSGKLENDIEDGAISIFDNFGCRPYEQSPNNDILAKNNTFLKKTAIPVENIDCNSKLEFNSDRVIGELDALKDDEKYENDDSDDGGTVEIVNIDGKGFLLVQSSMNIPEQESLEMPDTIDGYTSNRLLSNHGLLESLFFTLRMDYIYTWLQHCYECVVFQVGRLHIAARHYLGWRAI